MTTETPPYYEALPSNLQPVDYTVSVYDIDVEKETFSGTVDIRLVVKQETDEIHLNYRDITVIKDGVEVILEDGDSSKKIEAKELNEFKSKEYFVIKLAEKVASGELMVSLKYNAIIQTNMAGFYKSGYTEDQQGKIMLSTQFEATDARRAYPCVDEPAVKATFSVNVTITTDWVALANTPVESTKDLGNGLHTISFEKTPKMSTYLLAWACGDFEYIESFTEDTYYDNKPLPIRIYTTKGYSKDAHFASTVAPKIIDYFSRVFEIKYPLPKLDLIAVHSFSHNAMENWGLVTYRSNALLFDEEKSDPSYKNKVCYVIAHELAHQWFGDLVTMKWWDELWLNEGFATWVGFLAVDYLKPEWDIFTSFVSDSLQQALSLDGFRSSHPIQVPVVDALDIDQLFDAISYLKGASIILMLSSYIGTDIFLKGVAKYLNNNKFGNATTVDLWNAIGEASGKPINQMMNNWTGKIGFPIINVEFQNNQLALTQSRFLNAGDVNPGEDDTVWWVPLNISTGASHTEVAKDISIDSFSSKKVLIENFPYADKFFKLNKDSKGVYRVNYDPEILENIILPNFGKLTSKDKIGLVADVAAIAISGNDKTSTVTLLNLIKLSVDSNTLGEDYNVWADLDRILQKISVIFSGNEKLNQGIDHFLTYVYSKLAHKLLKELKENDDKVDEADFLMVKLRANIFLNSGKLLISEMVEYARELFHSDKPIHPSLNLFVYSTIAKSPDISEEEFEIINKQITNPQSLNARENALTGLTNISNLKYLDTLLKYLSDPSKLMDFHFLAQGLALNRNTRDQFWQHFKENYDSIYGIMSSNLVLMERFVRFAFIHYQSQEMLDDVQSFFKSKGVVGFERSYHQVIDNITTNHTCFTRDGEKLTLWLQQNNFI